MEHTDSPETRTHHSGPPTEETATASADAQIRQVLEFLDNSADQEALSLLTSLHPADQAQALKATSDESRERVAPMLTAPQYVAILEHLDAQEAVPLLQGLPIPVLSSILNQVSPDLAADLLGHLPPELATETLSQTARAAEIIPLMGYGDETAGGMMSRAYITVSDATTMEQAMAMLRQIAPLPQQQARFFVVDAARRLLGTVSLHDLVFSRLDSRVHEVMQEIVVSVGPDVDQEECVRIMERYDLVELPVIDNLGRLLGIIPFQSALDVAQEEATEDMFHLAGLSPGENVASSVGHSIAQRLPWLLVNLGTVVLAAAVITLFESVLARLVILAAFLPVVAAQGGVAGTQTLTLVVRSMALGEISFRSARSIVLHEVIIGVVNGLVTGIVIGIVGLVWQQSLVIGIAVFIAMLTNMTVAGLAGALVPLGLRALGHDPAMASVVFVTTFTDVTAFAMLLGTAALLLRYL